ncbi:MAG: hypothetical protein AAFS10_23195, partial [Myxococcota bacterium]
VGQPDAPSVPSAKPDGRVVGKANPSVHDQRTRSMSVPQQTTQPSAGLPWKWIALGAIVVVMLLMAALVGLWVINRTSKKAHLNPPRIALLQGAGSAVAHLHSAVAHPPQRA